MDAAVGCQIVGVWVWDGGRMEIGKALQIEMRWFCGSSDIVGVRRLIVSFHGYLKNIIGSLSPLVSDWLVGWIAFFDLISVG